MSASDDSAVGASGWASQLQKLRAAPRVALILAVAAAAAILVGVLLWSSTDNYGVLFSGLNDQAGGKIVARLDKMNMPYRFRAGGSTIMIPSAEVDRVRLKLAGDGLPKRGGVGFGLMDNEPLGISKFAERVNYQRALQGELARSIRTIGVISSARVNLAMPKSSVFVRQRKHAKASVIVSLYAGRSLSAGQVRSIQHLVASSVSRLPVDAVTVVNDQGALLSRRSDPGSGMDVSHLAYVAKLERAYREKIDALLSPILGGDNFRVQVNADLNFARREKTREQYGPNQADNDAAIRSIQRQYNVAGPEAGKGGIPGALSNQPSPDPPSPINGAQQQGNQTAADNTNARAGSAASTGAQQTADASPGNRTASNSTTTNYELNHTVEHVKQPMGRIERISAAVVVNARPASRDGASTDKPAAPNDPPAVGTATKPASEAAPAVLNEQQLARIKTLVRSAIGYSSARGDSVSVMRSRFSAVPKAERPDPRPWWQDGDLRRLVAKALTYLVVALVALFVWRKIIKPLVDSAAKPQQPALAQTGGGNTLAAHDRGLAETDSEGQQREQRRQQHSRALKTTQQVARDDPRMVAMIVKNWMRGDG